ncbi:sensor histidine kinase [Streptomyces sp. MUM 136J]|uniref:ATP-binding protein n=1 Tax=Streptomyces sp. MUM 136J TaxID=2791992 RepID=UPI001F047D9A|nr:ATP-binding protein [Streptomyces sp. MUM 136J]MCH0568535.1 sensor histidine kinase [Streptomyces sp. MUM 136J]
MIEIPDLVAGGLAAGTLSALALGGGLLHARRQLTRQRAESAALRRQHDEATRAFITEIDHLASRRLPAAARALAHPHVVVPGPLDPQTTGTPLGLALDGVLQGLRAELAAQHVRVDAAAQAGMRGATREIQAALYRLQDALRGLQQQYDDPELAQTLFRLDHENEQSLRRAQVAAVVCGAWVGLAREESHLVDAVTGGQARLAGYRRVTVHNHLQPGTALVSHAVEPVAIITAELLDNALRHSSPDTDVLVSLEHVHHGVCVTVDDAGVGMTPDERERAQRLVAGREPILLTDLGDPPRMGLAAIGQLTRQFDLSVDISTPSPYGGVRAVLLVAEHLLSRIDPTERPPAASAPRSTREGTSERHTVHVTAPPAGPADGGARQDPVHTPPDAPAHTYGAEPPGTGTPRVPAHDAPTGVPGVPPHDDPHGDALDTGGLPRRRRRTPMATGQEPAPQPPAPQPAAPHRPEQAAAALGALQSATAAARAAGDPAHTPNDSDHTDHEGGAAR